MNTFPGSPKRQRRHRPRGFEDREILKQALHALNDKPEHIQLCSNLADIIERLDSLNPQPRKTEP